VGLILIAIGFVAAAVAGFWIAVQLTQRIIQPLEAAAAAGMLFVPIGVLVLGGIYMRTRGMRASEAESFVHKQRQLVDLLNVRGTVQVSEMAAALQVDEADLREMVEQLTRLDIFTGRVDWEQGIMYAAARPIELSDYEPHARS
jgi:hypothetical protein